MLKQFSFKERAVKRRATELNTDQITDQSMKKACDINNIVKQIAKTGVIPPLTGAERYLDCTDIPTLEESHEIIKAASNAFYTLPSDIRKLMDNDPSQLQNFVSDDNNREMCLKYGLIEKITQEKTPEIPKVEIPPIPAKTEVKNEETKTTTDSATN